MVIISFFSVGGDSGAQRRVTEECGVVIKSFVGWSVRLSVGWSVGRSVGRSVGPCDLAFLASNFDISAI